MEKSVHYISNVKIFNFTPQWKSFWMHNSLRKSQKALTERTHSRETWGRNVVKPVLAEMNVTCVAGGISGWELCLAGGAAWRLGASQIRIFAARESPSRLRRRRMKNPVSYADWTRYVLINLGMNLNLTIRPIIYAF